MRAQTTIEQVLLGGDDGAALARRLGDRFIIQREHGRSSWFAFTVILNPKMRIDRAKVMAALKKADIGYRIITGGCFLRHDVIKYFGVEVAEWVAALTKDKRLPDEEREECYRSGLAEAGWEVKVAKLDRQ